MRKILIAFTMRLMMAFSAFAATDDDLERALVLLKGFRLNVKNCPTLEQVAENQLTNVKWDNPGGGDQFYCYAKVMGMQSDHEVFSAVFRYDIETKSIEPFSVRIGKRLYVKMEAIQKALLKLYAAESPEVRQIMQRMKI